MRVTESVCFVLPPHEQASPASFSMCALHAGTLPGRVYMQKNPNVSLAPWSFCPRGTEVCSSVSRADLRAQASAVEQNLGV